MTELWVLHDEVCQAGEVLLELRAGGDFIPSAQHHPWYQTQGWAESKLGAWRLFPCLTFYFILEYSRASNIQGFPGGSVVKNRPANAEAVRDAGSIPGSGRSLGGGNGNPLQSSCLDNAMDRGAWWNTVHGVTKSWTWLNWLSIHAHSQLTMLTVSAKGLSHAYTCNHSPLNSHPLQAAT